MRQRHRPQWPMPFMALSDGTWTAPLVYTKKARLVLSLHVRTFSAFKFACYAIDQQSKTLRISDDTVRQIGHDH